MRSRKCHIMVYMYIHFIKAFKWQWNRAKQPHFHPLPPPPTFTFHLFLIPVTSPLFFHIPFVSLPILSIHSLCPSNTTTKTVTPLKRHVLDCFFSCCNRYNILPVTRYTFYLLQNRVCAGPTDFSGMGSFIGVRLSLSLHRFSCCLGLSVREGE